MLTCTSIIVRAIRGGLCVFLRVCVNERAQVCDASPQLLDVGVSQADEPWRALCRAARLQEHGRVAALKASTHTH